MNDEVTINSQLKCVPYFSTISHSSHEHFISLMNNAKKEIIFIGLTCNFYLSKSIKEIIIQKSQKIPIKILILHPHSKHRIARYELEPAEAKYRDPDYFIMKVIEQYNNLRCNCDLLGKNYLEVYFYDFTPLFGFELIDETIRVRLYGYLKRGTDSPIFVISKGTDIFNYFENQIRSMIKSAQLMPIENFSYI